MKIIRNLLISLACFGALAAMPTATAEPEPSPSPTPHEEPSPTPHEEPSPTPHEEPSPTPHEEPSATPHEEPGDDHGGDDNGGDDGEQGDFSLHGFYEGTTASGALAIFYIESNTNVQINVLDVTGQQIGFAEGDLTNGAFALTLTNSQAISGNATEDVIEGTLAGQPFRAEHVATFGEGSPIGGRYVGAAHGPTGDSTVMFILDANNHIVMVQVSSTGRSGGYGTVTAPVTPSTTYTFTLAGSIGSSSPITGSFTIVDGVFSGSFTTSDGTYTVTSFKESLANHMANISTRSLVGPDQGQLIGGFIITGGPKMVIIRALGPSLAASGVSPVLANPTLQLFARGTLLASNDDWGTNANAAQIAASAFAPANALESALLVRLEPGAYTTVVSNADGSPAIALLEVYELGFE